MGPLLFRTLTSLKRLKLNFPDDLGLVSFDDWEWSRYVQKGIYLLEQDPTALGEQAASNLCRQMEAAAENQDPYQASRSLVLPVRDVPASSI